MTTLHCRPCAHLRRRCMHPTCRSPRERPSIFQAPTIISGPSPSTRRCIAMASREQKIEIRGGSGTIDGTLVLPGVLVPGVLFVHGWGGSQQQYLARAREVAALGCVCLAFDLGGHAGTQPRRETVSRESNLYDVLSAYDALAAHPSVDSAAIGVVGSSYGGYLATILTSMRPVSWLALRVPALYIASGWELPKLQLHQDQDLRTYRRSFVAAG